MQFKLQDIFLLPGQQEKNIFLLVPDNDIVQKLLLLVYICELVFLGIIMISILLLLCGSILLHKLSIIRSCFSILMHRGFVGCMQFIRVCYCADINVFMLVAFMEIIIQFSFLENCI